MKNQLLALLAFAFFFSFSSCGALGKKSTETNDTVTVEPGGVPIGEAGEDPNRREEELTVWIGPQLVEARCGSPMAPPSCREMRHQSQYGELNKNGEWKPLYDFFQLPDFEPGYIYHVRYIKTYLTDEELEMIADHPGYEVKKITVLSKEKY